jgi:methylated-DNA-[protein]-cysteine S-methyltransferase
MDTLFSLTMDSPVGALRLVASETALRYVEFHGGRGSPHAAEENPSHPVLQAAKRQLEEYFAGRRRDFDLPFDAQGTSFQRQTWNALCAIPYGETRSYAQQAEHIGNPKACRAVGATNGKNPLPIVIPCHRVVGSNGSLTGFGGGIETKRRLLALEQGALRASHPQAA